MSVRDRLLALALLLMPLTYGTKFALGLESVTWVDPTLLIGLLLFLIVLPPMRPLPTVLILAASVVSAAGGFFLLETMQGGFSGIYAALREPIRLGLNVVLFWVVVDSFARGRRQVLVWLSWSVAIQLVLAVYMWLGAINLVPLPEPIGSYARDYAMRQVIWVGQTPIMRLGGTFIESPPFGLFMISALVMFTLQLWKTGDRSRILVVGWWASLTGTLFSLSDQVLLAFGLFVILGLLSLLKGRRAVVAAIIGAVLLLAISPYMISRLSGKIAESSALRADEAANLSGGERFFHTRLALEYLADHPAAVPFGIGPGRYGQYANKLTGVFPTTVTPQVTPTEWLIEHGLTGILLIGWWLWLVGRRAWDNFGLLGAVALATLLLANLFQGNWKWEAWFVALAFLYTPFDETEKGSAG